MDWVEENAISNSSRSSRSMSKHHEGRMTTTSSLSQYENGGPSHPHMTLYNSVIEEKIVIEQIDTGRERLARERASVVEHNPTNDIVHDGDVGQERIQEQYRRLSATIQNLLEWLTSIEKRLSSLDVMRESVEECKRQLKIVQSIREDLSSHSEDVSSCLNQIRVLVSIATDVLTTEEISSIESYGKTLKSRYELCTDYAENLSRKIESGYEELRKYKSEATTFMTWMEKSFRTLQEAEANIHNLNTSGRQRVKEFVSDVVGHQGDLRFISMSAQKFQQESKAYLQVLNHYRSNNRESPLREKESIITKEVDSLTSTYSELLARANALFDQLASGNRRKEFEDAVDRAMAWLQDVTPRAQKLLSEPINPKQIDSQLARAKSLQAEIGSEGKSLVDAVRLASKHFLELEGLSAADRNTVNNTAKGIEDRYNSLRDSVNAKVNSLESASGLLSKIMEQLKQLRQILEREEGRCPSARIVLQPSEIESAIRTCNSILDVLNENNGLLETTKNGINDLIRKSTTDDFSSLRDSYIEIDKRWKDLQKSCKGRLELLQALKEFQRLYAHLFKWLGTKEKMINVLVGSVGSEASVIAHQLQQIQLIRDEFRAEKPKLDSFNEAGDAILAQTNPTSATGKEVDDQLVSINSKWNELLSKLNDAETSLQDVSTASNDFYKGYNKLAAALAKISDDLDDLAADKDGDKDLLLRKLNELAKQLAGCKPLLGQVQDAGQRLMDLLNDPASKRDIAQKVDHLGRQFDNCQRKIDALREALDSSKREAEAFADAARAAQQRLADLLAQLGRALLISADREILKDQVREFERIYRAIAAEEQGVMATMRQGKALAAKSGSEQRRSIQANLDALQGSWDTLKKEAEARHKRLSHAMELCSKYDGGYEPFTKWLTAAERKLEAASHLATFKKGAIDAQLQELNALRSEVGRRAGEYESTNNSGHKFLDSTDKDKGGVTRELQELKIRWDALNNALAARVQQLEDFSHQLGTFNGHVGDAKRVLDKCEDQLKNTDSKDPNALQKLKAIADSASKLAPQLDAIQNEGEGLCGLADDEGADSGHIRDAVDDLLNRYGALQDALEGRGNDLEAAAAALAAFKKKLKALGNDLSGLEAELAGMKGIGRDIPTVQDQIAEMKAFDRKVAVKRSELETATAETADLIRRGIITDAPAMHKQLDELKKQLGRIVTKSDGRSSELDKTLKRLQDFYKLYHATDGAINDLIRDDASMFRGGFGGGDIDAIKALQRAFDDFRARRVAPVGKQVEELNKLGSALIASASPNVNTTGLRTDLDKLNDKWNRLKSTLAERQRGLEDALLKSGNFKEALAKFMAWLRSIDDLLVQDGKIHGDVDTVMGLVKAHKKIEDQVSSRRAQLDEIVATGEGILASAASGEERTKISSQLREAKSAYEGIKSKVNDKSRRLDGALLEAHALNKAVTSMLDWLANAEKKKARLSVPLPDDERATAQLLDEQETFLREIANKESDKNATIELARAILAKAHPNAVNIIKHWIATIQSKWDELYGWAQSRHEKLLAHLNKLRDNDKFLDELLAWLKKKQDGLVKLESQVLPDDMDKLRDLILEHNELMREVMRRNTDVDSACKPKGGAAAPLLRGARGSSPAAIRREAKSDLFPSIGPKFEGQNFHHKSPRSKNVWETWKDVWQLCWERQRRLREKYNQLVELSKIKPFSWDDWRKRFLKHMNHNKERVKGLFTKFDRHNNGLIPRERFITAITDTNFVQTDAEMETVADMFEEDNNLVNYPEFIAALRPDWRETKPVKEDIVINDEIERQVNKCTCKQKFRVYQVTEGQYRFGESQKLRLVRVLRSTVMIRVGGGWVTLEEFLLKNDPCRAQGRTNIELRDQLSWPESTTQSMQAFVSKRRPGSRTTSPAPTRESIERGIRSSPMYRARSIERHSSPESTHSSSRHRHPSSGR